MRSEVASIFFTAGELSLLRLCNNANFLILYIKVSPDYRSINTEEGFIQKKSQRSSLLLGGQK